jgi:hypothetical protein
VHLSAIGTMRISMPEGRMSGSAPTVIDWALQSIGGRFITCRRISFPRRDMLRSRSTFSSLSCFVRCGGRKIWSTSSSITVEKCLARILLRMTMLSQPEESEKMITPTTREAIAETISTTQFRVSKLMNSFRKLGYIQYNGRMMAHESLLNVALHDP